MRVLLAGWLAFAHSAFNMSHQNFSTCHVCNAISPTVLGTGKQRPTYYLPTQPEPVEVTAMHKHNLRVSLERLPPCDHLINLGHSICMFMCTWGSAGCCWALSCRPALHGWAGQ
jgi:hypothetical protein